MNSLEESFQTAEEAARIVSMAVSRLQRVAKKLEKAARVGHPANLRAARLELQGTLPEVCESVEAAATQWPWSDSEETELLAGVYIDE